MSNYFQDYDVLSEAEALGLIEEGRYEECFIRTVEVKPSKSSPGKHNVVLTVDVYDHTGRPQSLTVGLYFKHMLRELCVALGILEKYNTKTIDLFTDIQGKTVGMDLGVKPANDGYRASNTVNEFFTSGKPFNDDITF